MHLERSPRRFPLLLAALLSLLFGAFMLSAPLSVAEANPLTARATSTDRRDHPVTTDETAGVPVMTLPRGFPLPLEPVDSAYDREHRRTFMAGVDTITRETEAPAVYDFGSGQFSRLPAYSDTKAVSVVDELGVLVLSSATALTLISLDTMLPVGRYDVADSCGDPVAAVGRLWINAPCRSSLVSIDLQTGQVDRVPALSGPDGYDTSTIKPYLAVNPERPDELIVTADYLILRVQVSAPTTPRGAPGATVITQQELRDDPVGAAFSPDGDGLYVAHRGNRLERLDPESLRPVAELDGSYGNFTSLEIAPDGRIATTSDGPEDRPEALVFQPGVTRAYVGFEAGPATTDCCIGQGEPIGILAGGLTIDGDDAIAILNVYRSTPELIRFRIPEQIEIQLDEPKRPATAGEITPLSGRLVPATSGLTVTIGRNGQALGSAVSAQDGRFVIGVRPQDGGRFRAYLPPLPGFDRTFEDVALRVRTRVVGTWVDRDTFRARLTPTTPDRCLRVRVQELMPRNGRLRWVRTPVNERCRYPDENGKLRVDVPTSLARSARALRAQVRVPATARLLTNIVENFVRPRP